MKNELESSNITSLQKEFLEYIKFEKKYSEKTYSSYLIDLKLLNNFLILEKQKNLSDKTFIKLNITEFRSFFSYLYLKKKLSPTSRSRVLSTLRSFYKFLQKRKIIQDSKIFVISFPKTDKLCPRAISQEDTQRIIEYLNAQSDDWVAERDKALFTLTYASGLRISELLGLTSNKINQEYIKVTGKGNKDRIIPLIPKAYKILSSYLTKQPFKIKSNEPIFRGVKGGVLNPRIFQRIIANIRFDLNLPENFTPHSIRHSFATHLLENDANIRQVQGLLGHESITSTEKYLKISNKHLISQFQKLQTFKKES